MKKAVVVLMVLMAALMACSFSLGGDPKPAAAPAQRCGD